MVFVVLVTKKLSTCLLLLSKWLTSSLIADFLANVRNAGVRGTANSLFAGSSSLMVDGVMIHEFRHVFNTSGAATGASGNAGAAGYKWGAGANVVGGRASVLWCSSSRTG